MSKSAILVVDDDPIFLKLAADTFAAEGYKVATADNGKECLKILAKGPPDLLVMDLMMPGMLGTEVCGKIKADPETAPLPVVLLTATQKQGQEILCLDTGADDFMTKPVEWDKLLARCRALLRRSRWQKPPRENIQLGKFGLDYARKTVSVGAHRFSDLTLKEFELLYELAANSPKPLARGDLYRSVWGVDPPSEGCLKTVNVHIRRIRLKLGWPEGEYIGNIAGRGYFFKLPSA